MSLLDKVTKGKQIGAQVHVIMGTNGVGKTTWAAAFPDPLIIDLEDGSKHLETTRLGSEDVTHLEALQGYLTECLTLPYKTIVIDSVESLEGMFADAVCAEGKCSSIEKYEGGYGKGWMRTRELMRELFIEHLTPLKEAGKTIILTAHTQIKTMTDPVNNATFDRYIMRTNDKMASLIRDLADNVFFANFKYFTEEERGKKTKAFGDGQRVMFTQWRPGYDAKNRLELPNELPLSYDAFTEACTGETSASPDELIAEIKEMATGLDEALQGKVNGLLDDKGNHNVPKLKEIKNRLLKYVS